MYVPDRRLETTNDSWSWKVTRVPAARVFVIYSEDNEDKADF